MATLPNIPPVQGSGSQISNRVEVVKFHDGYEQSFVTGINPEQETVTLEWRYLSAADKNTLRTFFKTNLGIKFTWTNFDGETYSYKCETWVVTPQQGGLFDLSADLRRVY